MDGYNAAFRDKEVVSGFANSFIYAVVGTVLAIAVTVPAAYALSRNDLRGKNIFIVYFMVTMYVSGGLIPTYLLIKNLRMMDTIWAIVVPGTLSVYNMIVAMSFFRATIPTELLDAARIDGCSNTKFFIRIVVPLSGAIIAILVLYYGVGLWNSYFSALIYLNTRSKWPLQLILRNKLIISAGQRESIKDLELEDYSSLPLIQLLQEQTNVEVEWLI